MDLTGWTMGKVARPYKISLLANLRHAPIRLRASVDGLTEADMELAPVPGKWTTRKCLEHIVAVDLGWSDIFYEAVCPFHSHIKQRVTGWQKPAEEQLTRSVADALDVFEQNHREIVAFLERLPESSFDHEHPPVSWLVDAKIPFVIKESVNWGLSVHVDHHLIYINEKRMALGKPLDWMSQIRTA